jgi:hypothetical protein
MIRLVLLVAAALAASGGPAMAQSGTGGMVAIDGFPARLDLPPPADTAKPRFFVLPPVTPPPVGCAAAFDCRVRVIGAIQHDGAVMLNTTIFKW